MQDDWLQAHRMSVFTMIVLTWVTCGFYVPYWYMKRQPFFDSLGSSTRLGSNLPIVAFVLAGIYDLMAFAPVLAGPQHSSQGLALLAELAVGIVNLVMAFKGKQILLEASRETGPPVATSSLATFFFQAFYLQYCLNRISARARPRDVAHVFE